MEIDDEGDTSASTSSLRPLNLPVVNRKRTRKEEEEKCARGEDDRDHPHDGNETDEADKDEAKHSQQITRIAQSDSIHLSHPRLSPLVVHGHGHLLQSILTYLDLSTTRTTIRVLIMTCRTLNREMMKTNLWPAEAQELRCRNRSTLMTLLASPLRIYSLDLSKFNRADLTFQELSDLNQLTSLKLDFRPIPEVDVSERYKRVMTQLFELNSTTLHRLHLYFNDRRNCAHNFLWLCKSLMYLRELVIELDEPEDRNTRLITTCLLPITGRTCPLLRRFEIRFSVRPWRAYFADSKLPWTEQDQTSSVPCDKLYRELINQFQQPPFIPSSTLTKPQHDADHLLVTFGFNVACRLKWLPSLDDIPDWVRLKRFELTIDRAKETTPSQTEQLTQEVEALLTACDKLPKPTPSLSINLVDSGPQDIFEIFSLLAPSSIAAAGESNSDSDSANLSKQPPSDSSASSSPTSFESLLGTLSPAFEPNPQLVALQPLFNRIRAIRLRESSPFLDQLLVQPASLLWRRPTPSVPDTTSDDEDDDVTEPSSSTSTTHPVTTATPMDVDSTTDTEPLLTLPVTAIYGSYLWSRCSFPQLESITIDWFPTTDGHKWTSFEGLDHFTYKQLHTHRHAIGVWTNQLATTIKQLQPISTRDEDRPLTVTITADR